MGSRMEKWRPTICRSVSRAAGVVTGLLPIPQPMLLVGPGSSRRLGETLCGFGHTKILIVTDRTVSELKLAEALTEALTVEMETATMRPRFAERTRTFAAVHGKHKVEGRERRTHRFTWVAD